MKFNPSKSPFDKGDFKKYKIGNYFGFTLIEILAVVGMTGLLIVSVGSVLASFFRAKTRTETTDVIRKAATMVTDQLKTNVLAAVGVIDCYSGVGETAMVFETDDGGQTKLFCDSSSNKIASESAQGTYNLLSAGVLVTDCSQFINCTTLPSTEVSLVNFKFSLGVSGGETEGESQTFETKVAVRE